MTFSEWFKKQEYPLYRREDPKFKAELRSAWNAAAKECLNVIHRAESKRHSGDQQP